MSVVNRILILLIALVACRIAFSAEEEWEASPRGALALTKGKSAASSLVTTSNWMTPPTQSVPSPMVSTADGSIYYIDSSNALQVVASGTTTAAACGSTAALATSTLWSLTSNGYDLYYVTAVNTATITATKLTITPTVTGSGKSATFGAPDCTGTTTTVDFTSSLAAAAPVAMVYAPGFVPSTSTSCAKGKGKGKSCATDAVLIAEDGTNSGILGIYSATGGSQLFADIGVDSGSATPDLPSSPTCTGTFGWIASVAASSTAGVGFFSSYADPGATTAGAAVYKFVISATGCTSVTQIAGSATGHSAHTAGSPGELYLSAAGATIIPVAAIGNFVYVGDSYGVAVISPSGSSYTLSKYIGGEGGTLGQSAGVGTFATFYEPWYFLAPSGKTSGTLYVMDENAAAAEIRKLTWAGAAKAKVGKKM